MGESIVYLEPVGPGKEHLHRITLNLAEDSKVILGRNVETGLDDRASDGKVIPLIVYLSRNHLEVKVENQKVLVKPMARQPKSVYLNGMAIEDGAYFEMNVGDTICLLGRLSHFGFKLVNISDEELKSKRRRLGSDQSDVVEIMSANNDSPQIIGPSSSSSLSSIDTSPLNFTLSDSILSAGSGVSSSVVKPADVIAVVPSEPPAPVINTSEIIASVLEKNEMNDHIECSICLCTLAFPHNVIPCGDTFCYSCIHDWASKKLTCPHCQQAFDAKFITHNRVLDNMIGGMMRLRGGEVLAEWEQREEAGKALKRDSTSTKSTPASSTSQSRSTTTIATAAPHAVRDGPSAAAIAAYFRDQARNAHQFTHPQVHRASAPRLPAAVNTLPAHRIAPTIPSLPPRPIAPSGTAQAHPHTTSPGSRRNPGVTAVKPNQNRTNGALVDLT